MLIIFGGLPGTGKTTIARELSFRLGATYLRIDSIEQAMTNSTLKIYPTEDAGYWVGYYVAKDNLRLDHKVVADSVNSLELTRSAWLEVAREVGCPAVEVEVMCSDIAEHKERIETRTTDLPKRQPTTWQKVLDRYYEPWTRPHITIDTAGNSVDQCVGEFLDALLAER
ncbi:MAG: AAA family ATPase [Geminicoccaceae bacterium]